MTPTRIESTLFLIAVMPALACGLLATFGQVFSHDVHDGSVQRLIVLFMSAMLLLVLAGQGACDVATAHRACVEAVAVDLDSDKVAP